MNSQADFVTLYHGTSSRDLRDKVFGGLQPRSYGEIEKTLNGARARPASVYVTTSKDRAVFFAALVAERREAGRFIKPVVLTLQILRGTFYERFVQDEAGQVGDYRTELPVAREEIVTVSYPDAADVSLAFEKAREVAEERERQLADAEKLFRILSENFSDRVDPI